MSLDIPAEESRQPSETEQASAFPARRSRAFRQQPVVRPSRTAKQPAPRPFTSSTATGCQGQQRSRSPAPGTKRRSEGQASRRRAAVSRFSPRGGSTLWTARIGLCARSSRVEKVALGDDHGSRDLQVADILVRHFIRLAGRRTVVGRQPFDNRNSAHGAPEPVFAEGSSTRVGTRCQLPEQRPPKPWVAGSSPVGRTNQNVRPRPASWAEQATPAAIGRKFRLTGKSSSANEESHVRLQD